MSKVEGIGVPIKLLHDCYDHIVCVETVTGEMFRGLVKGTEVCSFDLSLHKRGSFISFFSFLSAKKPRNC